jgi:7-cyano-7-deazaguanine synthase in queuosine biosynthesis
MIDRSEFVLLYSGGMDSLIAAMLYPQAEKLYIHSGSQYADKEVSAMHGLGLADGVTFDNRLFLGDVERDDAIVPARNLLFVTIAALYGNRIILNSVKGDNSSDKDIPFAQKSSDLLSHIFGPPHFNPPQEIEVLLPMKHLSKVEWLKWYLNAGGDPVVMSRSVSCYHPTELYCGQCKACIRKWVAQETNGITSTPWKKHPSTYAWSPHIEKILKRQWRCPEEDQATEALLRQYRVIK